MIGFLKSVIYSKVTGLGGAEPPVVTGEKWVQGLMLHSPPRNQHAKGFSNQAGPWWWHQHEWGWRR